MNMDGNFNGAGGSNKYQYNQKELNTDFGLNWNDYGARFYDASIARWVAVDPMAEKTLSFSPYNYGNNNPVSMKDVDGNFAVSVHYDITYGVLRGLGYSKERADLIAHYASVYADHPPFAASYIDFTFHAQRTNAHSYRKGIDYSRTAGSQKEENSKWHSMMSDAEAKSGMTETQALNRGLKFGWDKIFEFANNSNGDYSGEDLGSLGQGIHALQDAVAHQGIKTHDHLGFNLSSGHKLTKDMYGNTQKASELTKSAFTVVNLLQGNKVSLKVGDRINVTGMSDEQKKQVLSAIKAQGFSTENYHVKK